MTNTPGTLLLARELVELERQIKQAAHDQRYLDAFDLEQTREHVLYVRMSMLRRHWTERDSEP